MWLALLQLGDCHEAAKDLLALVDMINQAVGDALSGILLVEAALRRRGWGLTEWADLYTDLPSRQLKVRSVPPCTIYQSSYCRCVMCR